MNDNWEEFACTYELTNTRVVAILDEDGGAIVETHPALVINEGRMETIGTDGQGQQVSSLDYGLSFSPKGQEPGESTTGYNAHIVIRGTASNGRTMEIRGMGTIGHDENGGLDGMFHNIPSIYIPDEGDIAGHLDRLTDQWGGEPKGEFILATYGRAQDWSWR